MGVLYMMKNGEQSNEKHHKINMLRREVFITFDTERKGTG